MKKKFYMLIILSMMTMAAFSGEKKKTLFSIPVEKYTLQNGLTVILHEDHSDPITAVAIYYHVGSSRETEGKTGYAHLFEHMMFQESENLPRGEFVKNISNAGGTFNGSTNQDRTNYFEVLPKNYLEQALWMESDRMGFLENAITKSNLANQQDVVMNEKRQSYDNTPYGFNQMLILKNLYPKGHPYSWDVIGSMQDLVNASITDVKSFHHKFYAPNNAFLVISGDFEKTEVKSLVRKYFGELPAGVPIDKRKPMPVTLSSTVKLYHEDNFARAPQLTIAFPAAERYSKDTYALNFLGDLLANSKKAPLYTVLVKDKKLTSRLTARNMAQELAGSFTISVTANPGVSLTDVEKAIFEGLQKFEKDGFSEEDITRIKAGYETRFYNSFASVQGKAFSLAEYTMNTGDPEYYKVDLKNTEVVTMSDIKAVYNKYIKGKNFVETSFVPKGDVKLAVEGSVNAGIKEEDIKNAAQIKADTASHETIVKTKTEFDRSVMPMAGPDTEVKIPALWTGSLSNGLKIWGIKQSELPLVNYSLVIDGGHLRDIAGKEGLANMVATIMNEGTRNKTPEELENAIGMLGATIRVTASNENISVDVSTLTRNFEKSLSLVEEILLEPRWDEEQFGLASSRVLNNLKRNTASPDYLATSTLNKLMFGNSVLASDAAGTITSVPAITLSDCKDFYSKFFSPSVSRFLIAGDVDRRLVENALSDLDKKWAAKEVKATEIIVPPAPSEAKIYFVDLPGAKQSVISIGAPSLTRTSPDFFSLVAANYKLGAREASIAGLWMQIIREQKGYTYGAYSSVNGFSNYGYFVASSRVRTNATTESVNIFRTEMEKYRQTMPKEYIDFTVSGMIKANARKFETLGSLVDYLNNVSSYDLTADYVMKEEAYLRNLTPEKQLEVVRKYIDPSKMYFVVVGDAQTQLKDLEKVGLGAPVLLDNK